MSVTRDTSHLPISPNISLEHRPSAEAARQRLTANIRSVLERGEKLGFALVILVALTWFLLAALQTSTDIFPPECINMPALTALELTHASPHSERRKDTAPLNIPVMS